MHEQENDREETRTSDQEGQRGDNTDGIGRRNGGRDHVPAPVAGSKDDKGPPRTREDLKGPLSGETERSGTHTDQ